MHLAVEICQWVVALGLLNVWLLRAGRKTEYRGGKATSMREEFSAYGLPQWCMYVVGALKVGAAICLIAGVWFPGLVLPAAATVAVLMVGALAMHLKVHDAAKKSLPAAVVLVLCAVICWGVRG